MAVTDCSGQWDTASKVDMKKDDRFKEIREELINEDFRVRDSWEQLRTPAALQGPWASRLYCL